MSDKSCTMYRVTMSGGATSRPRYMLYCDACGYTTNDYACKYCPNCGAKVESVTNNGDECDALTYAHDSGFDEGYQAAQDEE